VNNIQGQIQGEDPLMAGRVAHPKQDFLAVLQANSEPRDTELYSCFKCTILVFITELLESKFKFGHWTSIARSSKRRNGTTNMTPQQK